MVKQDLLMQSMDLKLFDIEGEITPRCDLTVVMTRANGEVVKFDVLCRLDTSAEVDVYKNGGDLTKENSKMLLHLKIIKYLKASNDAF